MCTDTKASNTGTEKGTCVLVEKYLGKTGCHHILELIPDVVCDALFGSSTGPKILLFYKFQKIFNRIIRNSLESLINYKIVSKIFPL